MNLLVTGGCGFIGTNLVRHALLEGGHAVTNVDLLTYAGNRHSLSDLEGSAGYELVVADICDADAMREVFARVRPDAVLHLAAESHVDRSIDGPDAFVRTNVVGTSTLLQVALEHWRSLEPVEAAAFRFIHVSTDEVYGSLGANDAPFTEDTKYDPHSPYAASKAASDHLARAWHDTYGLPVIVTNCSNNYGPYQFPEKLIPVIVLKALAGEPIPVYGAGDNVRDWLYVEDHVRALLRVLKEGAPGRTYNIGGNNEMRNIDVVRRVCALLDEIAPAEDGRPYGTLITFVTDRPGHDKRYAIDATRITAELGWTPTADAEGALGATVRWYVEHRDWWERILRGEYRLERIGLGTAGADSEEGS
ncbi:MAG: dTDP-glucose 4,6-dehydratase [Coriobacteriia bacterium]|nr:dTDP-glucose 4,6-dehydratase [Coriobacteriia bacterium]